MKNAFFILVFLCVSEYVTEGCLTVQLIPLDMLSLAVGCRCDAGAVGVGERRELALAVGIVVYSKVRVCHNHRADIALIGHSHKFVMYFVVVALFVLIGVWWGREYPNLVTGLP
jgi:hypothetical protein